MARSAAHTTAEQRRAHQRNRPGRARSTSLTRKAVNNTTASCTTSAVLSVMSEVEPQRPAADTAIALHQAEPRGRRVPRSEFEERVFQDESEEHRPPPVRIPAMAPARVDCTRCDTPMAAAAHMRPGPNAFAEAGHRSCEGQSSPQTYFPWLGMSPHCLLHQLSRAHSTRMASMGSSAAARRAGIQHATDAITCEYVAVTATSVSGSVGPDAVEHPGHQAGECQGAGDSDVQGRPGPA